jgi:hypothetical protein
MLPITYSLSPIPYPLTSTGSPINSRSIEIGTAVEIGDELI